ncbi:MAG: hypothetical protein FWD14_01840 [Treponema sp.]|nr:hypothetical protein [Treponema sp.]
MTFLSELIKSEETVKKFEEEYYINIHGGIKKEKYEIRSMPLAFQFGVILTEAINEKTN